MLNFLPLSGKLSHRLRDLRRYLRHLSALFFASKLFTRLMDAVTGTPTTLSLARIASQNVRVLRTVGSRWRLKSCNVKNNSQLCPCLIYDHSSQADLLFLYKLIDSVAFCPPLLQLINFYASAMSSRFTRSFLLHRYGSFLVNSNIINCVCDTANSYRTFSDFFVGIDGFRDSLRGIL